MHFEFISVGNERNNFSDELVRMEGKIIGSAVVIGRSALGEPHDLATKLSVDVVRHGPGDLVGEERVCTDELAEDGELGRLVLGYRIADRCDEPLPVRVDYLVRVQQVFCEGQALLHAAAPRALYCKHRRQCRANYCPCWTFD